MYHNWYLGGTIIGPLGGTLSVVRSIGDTLWWYHNWYPRWVTPCPGRLVLGEQRVVEQAWMGVERVLLPLIFVCLCWRPTVCSADGGNRYAPQIEEANGLDKIEFVQQSPDEELYQKAYQIIAKYFPDGDEGGISESGGGQH